MSDLKSYLGDSVYVDLVDEGIILTTENGLPNDPSNSIFLEVAVIQMLIKFLKVNVSHDTFSWLIGG